MFSSLPTWSLVLNESEFWSARWSWSLFADEYLMTYLKLFLKRMHLQNVKQIFDAAIRMVIKPPQKQHEKKKKQPRGCFLSVHLFLIISPSFLFLFFFKLPVALFHAQHIISMSANLYFCWHPINSALS